jgi:hypothetical protein
MFRNRWGSPVHNDDDSDSDEETFPEDARRLAREAQEAQARQSRWEAHFEARRALIAQVEWQPAPPDLDPNARVDGLDNFRDYVVNFAERLKSPSEWSGVSRAYKSTSTRIRVATIDDDAEFAATRLDHLRNQQEPARSPLGYYRSSKPRSGGDTARMRSEVGPKNALYMHAKTAKVVDSTAFMFKNDMVRDGINAWARFEDQSTGFMMDLPPDLLPFYEMELRCDPRRTEPASWRVDITAKREPDQTVETSALCVCRPVTRFRTFRGDDHDDTGSAPVPGDRLSFPDGGDAPAYVILTALRQRVFDSNGNELNSRGNERFNVDDYAVTTKRYVPILDLTESQFDVQRGSRRASGSVNFINVNSFAPWSRNSIDVLNKFPLMLEGDCFHNWKQLSRAFRSVGPVLADARLRAAERVYAPDAEGAEDARANFERLAREQERENRRRRDREAREAQSPRRTAAAGTLPSLAALRV